MKIGFLQTFYFAFGLLLLAGCKDGKPSKYAPNTLEGLDPTWLKARKEKQKEMAAGTDLFYRFLFSDEQERSGLRFLNKMTNEGGIRHKPNHYDHGNGLAVADVDGDGWHDLFMISQIGTNELWRNKGYGYFENITERSGLLSDEDGATMTAAFADTDNDGDPDLYVTYIREGNRFYENDGTGKFTEKTDSSGLGVKAHSSTPVFFDYDRDGLLDVFLTNVGVSTYDYLDSVQYDNKTYHYYSGMEDAFSGHLKPERTERSILFKNMGNNRFEDVTEATGLIDTCWSGDATPIDVNEDGWLDLYVLNMQGHDEYYENIEGQRFERKSREVFPNTPWGSMGVKVMDFDNDGRQDLYITDMHSDMSKNIPPEEENQKSDMKWTEAFLRSNGQSIFGNAFFKKEGSGKYTEISDRIGAENYWPWGLSTGDLNADGFEDAFLTSSMNYPFRYSVNTLLLNNFGKEFMDSELLLGVEPRKGRKYAKEWFELDCSGKDKDHRDCRGRKGKITIYGALGSRASAILDLDGDGDLDIVTNEFFGEPMVLISDLEQRKPNLRFVKINLVGTTSNRDGLGATVQVITKTDTYGKVMDGKSGYLSQSSLPLYFGLGAATQIEQIVVHWPSGEVQTIDGPVDTNTTIVITEGEGMEFR